MAFCHTQTVNDMTKKLFFPSHDLNDGPGETMTKTPPSFLLREILRMSLPRPLISVVPRSSSRGVHHAASSQGGPQPVPSHVSRWCRQKYHKKNRKSRADMINNKKSTSSLAQKSVRYDRSDDDDKILVRIKMLRYCCVALLVSLCATS